MNRQKKVSGHLTEKRLVKVCLNRLMLEEGQQEHLQMPSPLPLAPEESEISVERGQPTGFGTPIVPQVVQGGQVAGGASFGSGFSNFYNYVPQGGSNPLYFSFIFPNHFV